MLGSKNSRQRKKQPSNSPIVRKENPPPPRSPLPQQGADADNLDDRERDRSEGVCVSPSVFLLSCWQDKSQSVAGEENGSEKEGGQDRELEDKQDEGAVERV